MRQSLARKRRIERVTDTAAVMLLFLAVATAPAAAHAVTTPSTTVSTTVSPEGRTDTGQPGLGIAAFVAALVAVVLARRGG